MPKSESKPQLQDIRERAKLARETVSGAPTESYRRYTLGYGDKYAQFVFEDIPALLDEIERLQAINSKNVGDWNFYLIKSARLEDRLKLIERYIRERHEIDCRADTDTILNDYIEATDEEIAVQMLGEMSANGGR